MPAPTNIPISATTTDFVAAINAARAAVGQFTRDLNSNLTQSFRVADRQGREFNAGLGRLGGNLKSVGQNFTTYLTLPILAAGAAMFKTYADIDALQRGLSAVATTTDSASQQFTRLRDIAKLPGIGLAEAVQGSVRLQAVGFSAKAAEAAIRQFGNAIALTGGGKAELSTITTQLGQMAAKGKVLAQDLKPIIEAAPAAAGVIKRLFGTVDSEEISAKLKAQGKDAAFFIELLTGELSKLERVSGGPKNALENLGDSLKIASFNFIKTADASLGLTDKLNALGDLITRAADGFTKLDPTAQGLILTLTGVAAAVGPVSFAIGSLIKLGPVLLTTFTSGFGAIKAGLLALTGPIGLITLAATAIVGLTYSIVQFNQVAKTSVENSKLMASVNNEVNATIGEEKNRIESLLSVARNEAISKKARQTAIDQLNLIAPEYLSNLTLETINTDKTTAALGRYINQLELKARIQSLIQRKTDAQTNADEIAAKPATDFTNGTVDRIGADFSSVGAFVSQGKAEAAYIKKGEERRNAARQTELSKVKFYNAQLLKEQAKAAEQGIKIIESPAGAQANVFNKKTGSDTANIDALKASVKLAKEKIQDFIAKNGTKVKIPVELTLDYKQKAAQLKAATSATAAPKKAKAEKVLDDKDFGDLKLYQRIEERLQREVENLGKAAPESLLRQLTAIRGKIEEVKASASETALARVEITGVKEIANPATNKRVDAILQTVHDIAITTPGIFSKTGIKDFLTSAQQAMPGVEFLNAKLKEIKETIAALTFNKLKVPPELKTSLASVTSQLKAAQNAADLAEMSADPSRQDQGSAFNNIFSSAGVSADAIGKMQGQIAAAKDAINISVEEIAVAMESGRQQLRGAAVGLLSGIGESIGQGTNPLKSALKSILDILGGYLIQLGTALLLSSGALLAAAPLTFGITLAPGLSQQIAGAGLIVGGGIIKGLAGGGLKGFAKGGVFDQPSVGLFGEYAGATRNREIATPESLMAATFKGVLDRRDKSPFDRTQNAFSTNPTPVQVQVGGTFRVDGRDLMLVIARQGSSSNTYGSGR